MGHSVTRKRPLETSAEPISNDPWEELRLCQGVVLADGFPEYGEPVHATIEDVYAAALAVERAAQVQLRAAGGVGATLEMRYARPLWNAQYQARQPVYAKAGKLKELQRRAADGSPALTVCVGYMFRRFPEHVMRFNAPDMFADENPGRVPLMPQGYGDGCGAIILDSTQPRRPKRYCDRCSARAGRTLNAGLAKSALARVRAGRRV